MKQIDETTNKATIQVAIYEQLQDLTTRQLASIVELIDTMKKSTNQINTTLQSIDNSLSQAKVIEKEKIKEIVKEVKVGDKELVDALHKEQLQHKKDNDQANSLLKSYKEANDKWASFYQSCSLCSKMRKFKDQSNFSPRGVYGGNVCSL